MPEFAPFDDRLNSYLQSLTPAEPPPLAALREQLHDHPQSRMQIPPEVSRLLALLIGLSGARQVLEIGTFLGTSGLAIALALPADGRLVSCDHHPTTSRQARQHWEEAGVSDRIDFHFGDALQTLADLTREQTCFDLVFIDADKRRTGDYLEASLPLLRPGGLVVIDNIFWGGAVADPDSPDPRARALRTFNATIRQDPRLEVSFLPLGDGLVLARKLP